VDDANIAEQIELKSSTMHFMPVVAFYAED
jgi:hypothetical protein